MGVNNMSVNIISIRVSRYVRSASELISLRGLSTCIWSTLDRITVAEVRGREFRQHVAEKSILASATVILISGTCRRLHLQLRSSVQYAYISEDSILAKLVLMMPLLNFS